VRVASTATRGVGEVDGTRLANIVLDLALHDQLRSQDAWDGPAPALWASWLPFAWAIPWISRRSLAQVLIARAKGEVAFRPMRLYALVGCLAWMVAAAIPWPHLDWHDDASDGVALPHSSSAELAPPAWRKWSLWPSFTVLWSFGGTLTLGLRGFMLGAAFMMLTRLAYVDATAVKDLYTCDRFAPIYYNGTLPDRFALPGYIANDVTLAPMADDATLRVRPPLRSVPDDALIDNLWAVGVVIGPWLPSVSLPCQQNLLVGLRNRQLAAVPAPDLSFFTAHANRYLAQFKWTGDVAEIDFAEWNARFDGARQRAHELAVETWDTMSTTIYEILVRKGFTKLEKIMRVGKTAFDPRVITGASDVFNVIGGPWFYKARDRVKEAYAQLRGNVVLASGMTSRELGSWFERALVEDGRAVCGDDQLIVVNGVIVELDGKRHDAHMHKLFHTLKWSLYFYLCSPVPCDVMEFVYAASRLTTGRNSTYGLKWTHEYRVRSGDFDTERGNSVCADFVAWFVQRCVRSGLEQGLDLRDIEALVVVETLKLGYEVSVKVTRDYTQATFLSGTFLPVEGDMFWAPLPGRQLSKIGWTLRNVKNAHRWRDYAGVLNSYRDFSFVPFLRKYVDIVSQLVPERYRNEPPSKRWTVGPGITPPAPAADTWTAFECRYGLGQAAEEAFAKALLKVDCLPHMLCTEETEQLVEVDLA
jgi:hypothetical protein